MVLNCGLCLNEDEDAYALLSKKSESREARSARDDISPSRLQMTIIAHRQNISHSIERLFRDFIEAYSPREGQG